MTHMYSNLREALTGISGILVTPFDDRDVVAPDKLGPIIDRAVNSGVDVLVANGNTSEFYALQYRESEEMMRAVVEKVAGRAPVLNGVGRSVGEACSLARASVKAGADGLMVHQPPDPFVAPRGLMDYVARVAESAEGLPLVLYLRHDIVDADNLARLIEVPGVIGVKWAMPTPVKLGQVIRAAARDVIWICGLAETWAPAMYAVGAQGFTSGLINVWPSCSVAIRDALCAGQYHQARQLIGEIEEFEIIRAEEASGINVTSVKAALQLLGNDCGPARAPAAWPLTPTQQGRMHRTLQRAGLV